VIPFFALASASSAVTALLGSSPVRLYPFGKAPQDVARPYAVWQVIGGSPENYLAQRPDIDGVSVQVDIYGLSAASVRAVRDALRDVVEGAAYITRWGGEDRDYETQNHHASFDADWLVPR